MNDSIKIANKDRYSDEFDKVGTILDRYLPDEFDYKELQIKIIDMIEVARSPKLEDGLYDVLLSEERKDQNAKKRLNEAIKQFRKIYQEPNIIKATWQEIHCDLNFQGIDHQHIKPIFDAIQAASEADKKRDKWLGTYETRGAKLSGKNAFAFYVASKLKVQLKSYTTARLVSELLEIFGVDSSVGAINTAFERNGVFTK